MRILGREFTAADGRRVIWTAIEAGGIAYPALVIALKNDTKAALLAFGITVGGAVVAALKNWFLADTSPVK